MASGKALYDAIIAKDEAGALELMKGPPVDVHAADFKPNDALFYIDPDSGNTTVLAACSTGLAEVVAKLLASDVPPNKQNKEGMSCLGVAASAGHLEVVRQLLECGADKTLKTNDGATALELAEKAGNKEVVEMMTAVDGRNLFNALMMKDEKTAAVLIEQGADIHWCEAVYGANSIIVAANRGLPDSVRTLIAKGGDVNSKQSYGFTCLSAAAYGGYLDVVKQLLEAGADKSLKTNDGATALDLAEKAGHAEIVALLKD